VDDFGQVALIFHHDVDVLVRAGYFVQHALVLAANDPSGLLGQIRFGETVFGGGSAHPPAGAVRAGAKTFGIALAAHDVAPGAHAAGHDAEVTLPRPDRSLAGDPDIGLVMMLPGDIIVVAVDDFRCHGEGWQMTP